MLEPSFKRLETSAATGHGNISDLHNSVYTSGGMTAERNTISMHAMSTFTLKLLHLLLIKNKVARWY